MKYILTLLAVLIIGQQSVAQSHMQWWRDGRFGMFVHWGLSSLTGGEISWSRGAYGAAKYDSLAMRFNPTSFDARSWVMSAKSAGMKYIVLTAKHHDGFCLWDTKTTDHNIINTPYGRDICRQLADAAHDEGLALGWYISIRDWKDENCQDAARNAIYAEKLKDQIRELLTDYGKVDLVWFDYDGWVAPTVPEELFALVKQLQPDIVINNRIEPLSPDEAHAFVGQYGEYSTPEQFVGSYGETPWETCANLARSGQWSWRKGDVPTSLGSAVEQLMRTLGANGNLLLNVGPDSLGVIPSVFAERLTQIGEWIKTHEKAVYGTKGGPLQPNPKYVTTRNGKNVYLTVFSGVDSVINLPVKLGRVVERIEIIAPDKEQSAELIRVKNGGYALRLSQSVISADNTIIWMQCTEDTEQWHVIAPPSKSGSLAYGAIVSASSSLSNNYMHDPSAAIDDNDQTAWVIGRRADLSPEKIYGTNSHFADEQFIPSVYNTDGWLQVDMPKAQKIGRMVLGQRNYYVNSCLEKVALEYEKGGKWIRVAARECTSPKDWAEPWQVTFPSVKARRWRVNIEKGSGYFGISEFQLFE